MSATCPNGHTSEWADYCSTCGEPLGGEGPSNAPAAPTQTVPEAGAVCTNCAEPHGPDDVFCENCGFDFASETLPDATGAAPAVSGSVAEPVVAMVSADRAYYDATIGNNDLTFPDPVPADVEIPLVGTKALIGRHSESRGIFPEIDVAAITTDPAASSRHAMLANDGDGNWSIEDLGSTNGTIIGDPLSDEIAHGVLIAVAHNTPIYVGAWTRIEIRPA